MGIRATVAGIVLAAGLGGCATDPSGMRYSDGSYHAGRDGGGDYYVGRDYSNVRYIGDPWLDDWGWFGGHGYYGFGYDHWHGGWYDDWYGWPGYCPASQRRCGGWGWGWNDPFPRHGFRIYVDEPWRGPRHRDGRQDPRDAGGPGPDAAVGTDAGGTPDAWRGDGMSDGPDSPWDEQARRSERQQARQDARRDRPPSPRPDAMPRPAREPRDADADGEREDPFPRARRGAAPRSDTSPRPGRSDGN